MDERNMQETIDGLAQITSALFDEIIELKKNKAKLEAELESQKCMLSQIVGLQNSTSKAISALNDDNVNIYKLIARTGDNVSYEIRNDRIPCPKIYDINETVEKLVENELSIGRLGDGEFSIMMGASRQGFQRQDNVLAERLKEVLSADEEGFMVAIADNYGSLDKFSDKIKNEIRFYMTDEVRRGHAALLEQKRTYYNAYITIPYQLSKEGEDVSEKYAQLKRLWTNRNLVIVEGKLSRFGVKNDLLVDAKTVKRILCPAENAFDRYDEILSACNNIAQALEKPIFVIALGPTATVLAYDLYKLGYQACDLGHMDIDYEYWLNNAHDGCYIKGKYINNLTSQSEVDDINDPTYENQIVIHI